MQSILKSKAQLLDNEYRRDLYKLLSECYYLPDVEFVNKLHNLDTSRGEWYADIAKCCPKIGDIDSLIKDYTKLFVGPYGILAPPYGSLYLEDSDRVMGSSTLDAIRCYKEEGLDVCLKEAPDHIAIELEYMYFLIFKELEATKNNDFESVSQYQEKQRTFLNNHLGAWIPDFTDKIEANAQTEFYKIIARITKNLIEKDTNNQVVEK
jgi:TorA maturation chaperone TorD